MKRYLLILTLWSQFVSGTTTTPEDYAKQIGLVMAINSVHSCDINMTDIGASYDRYLSSQRLSQSVKEEYAAKAVENALRSTQDERYVEKVKKESNCDMASSLNHNLIKKMDRAAQKTSNSEENTKKWRSAEHGIELEYPASWVMHTSPLPSVILQIKNCFLCGSQESFSIIVDDAGENTNKPSSTLFDGIDLKEFVRTSLGDTFSDAEFQRSGTINIAGINAPFILTYYTLKKSGQVTPRALLQAFMIKGDKQLTISWASSQTDYESSFAIFTRIIGSIKL